MSAEAAPVVADSDAPVKEEKYYSVAGNDGVEMKVSEQAIQQSGTLSDSVKNTTEGCAIPVPEIDGKTLELVLQWCEHHKGEAIPVDDDSIPKKVVISEFDEKLMEIDNERLFHLICAADYLDIKQLLDVSCKKVANMAKGKSPEELRVLFQIPTDEEDEATAREAQENAAREAVKKESVKEEPVKEEAEKMEIDKDVQGTSN